LPKTFVFPYIVPKAIYFRSVSQILLLLLFVFLFFIYKEKIKTFKFWSPITIAIVLFFVSACLSTFLGVDWYRSFWDNQERMLGFFTIIHYLILFLVARIVFNTKKDWRNAFFAFSIVGLAVVFIALIQRFINPEFLLNRGTTRVSATLGNPIYLGGLGLFLFFLGLYYTIIEKGWLKYFFGVVSFLGLLGLIFSETRGSFVGIFVGLVFSAVLYLVLLKGKEKIRKQIAIALALVFVLLGLSFVARDTVLVQNIQILNRVTHISPFEGTAKTRFMAWGVAIEGFQDRPFFGWGLNNYYYVFNTHFNPDFLTYGWSETWFDNAHGIFFNTLATQGLFGVLSYLTIYILAFYSLWRVYKRDPKNLPLFAIMGGFLIAHFVHNSFVFENITSYLYFFLVLAFLDSMFKPTDLEEIKNKQVGFFWLVLLAISAFIIIFYTNVNVAKANILGYEARKLMATGKVEESLSVYEQTFKWKTPYQPDINWDYAMDILYVLPHVHGSDIALAKRLYDTGTVAMDTVVSIYPRDVRGYLAYMDLLRSGGMVMFEIPEATDKVKEFLDLTEILSPGRPQIEFAKVTFLAGTGNFDEALELAKNLVEKYGGVADSYYTLGRLYKFNSQYKEVIPVLDSAINNKVRFILYEQQLFVAESYEWEGRFKDALYWYDQAYKTSLNERVAYKRDELSRLTQLQVPKSLEEFFIFEN
jgi:O-antigen ligase